MHARSVATRRDRIDINQATRRKPSVAQMVLYHASLLLEQLDHKTVRASLRPAIDNGRREKVGKGLPRDNPVLTAIQPGPGRQ